MSGADVFREEFPIHSYEVDAFGLVAPAALAGFLQEAAGLHAVAMGCGREALMTRGLTWVLHRQRVEVERPVALGDVLSVETWPTGVDRLAALRDFRARRGDGAAVLRATTRWLVMDLRTRRPVRPERVLEAPFREERDRLFPGWDGEIPAAAGWEAERRFEIRYQDIDVNMHVTNASYVAWAVETAPAEVWRGARLGALEAQYLAECAHGSSVVARRARLGESAFLHGLFREEDGRELARLRTTWVAR